MMDIGTESTSIYILHNFHPDIFDEIKYILCWINKKGICILSMFNDLKTHPARHIWLIWCLIANCILTHVMSMPRGYRRSSSSSISSSSGCSTSVQFNVHLLDRSTGFCSRCEQCTRGPRLTYVHAAEIGFGCWDNSTQPSSVHCLSAFVAFG